MAETEKQNNVLPLGKRRDVRLESAVSKLFENTKRVEEVRSQGEDRPEPLKNGSDQPPSAPSIAAEVALNPLAIHFLKTNMIDRSAFQAREMDADDQIDQLAQSIKSKGILQPIIVRPASHEIGRFELIAGERRLRAAQRVGLEEIPALVQRVDDVEAAELGLIENLQREDLNAIEESRAYKHLVEGFNLSASEIADAIGKSRSAVSNSLRLLQLPEEILDLIRDDHLTAGHGKALLMLSKEDEQIRFARIVLRRDLSVRALEHLIAGHRNRSNDVTQDESDDQEQRLFERQAARVQNVLQIEHVRLTRDKQGRRRMQIVFETEAEWRRFMSAIRD